MTQIRDYTPIIKNMINNIVPNKIVADLASGGGWSGLAALVSGAKFVKFSDARPERVEALREEIDKFQNFSISFVDLNTPNLHKDFLNDVDVVVYCGHLYHAFNHEEILNFIIDSNATEFIIDSKMFLDQDRDEPNITWYEEQTDDEYNIYYPEKEFVKIGWVSLSWVLNFLKSKNLTIVEILKNNQWYTGTDVNNPDFEYINFTIHCKK